MNKKVKVSVGIPAYNEQNNIENILNDVLAQKQDVWELSEVLVYSDGSDDKTIENATKVKSDYIKIFDFKDRAGKTKRLEQMFKEFSGDILMMFDADIKLRDDYVVSNIISTFESDKNIMLVGGNSKPFEPITFFQRAVFSTFKVFYASRFFFKNGNNIFGCTGSILAIKKEFAQKLEFPKIFNEDSYIYLECIKRNYKFAYCDKAVVYYKLPDNESDYIKQLFRSEPNAVIFELEKYYGDLAKSELKRPVVPYLKSILSTFLKMPAEVMYISAINIVCKPLIPIITKNYKLSWFTAKSTH